jgi:hypothetical protein
MASDDRKISPLALLGILICAFGLAEWLNPRPAGSDLKNSKSRDNTGDTQNSLKTIPTAEGRPPKSSPHRSSSHRKRCHVNPWLTFIVNLLTLIAVAYYAYLTRQQLIGTLGATVMFHADFDFSDPASRVNVLLRNFGKVPATKVNISITITKKRLPAEAVLSTITTITDSVPVLSPTNEQNTNSWEHWFDVPLSETERDEIRHDQLAIAFDGRITYFDGFSWGRSKLPICFFSVEGRMDACNISRSILQGKQGK